MENRAYALVAGLFTLLVGAGVVAAAMWLGRNTESRDIYELESRYPVSGLNVQAPVRFRGVEVGRVESIAFDPANPRLIRIAVSIRTDTPITRGTYAQLGSQGITGLAYVLLDDDGDKPQPLTPQASAKDRIPVRQAYFDVLADSGRDLVMGANEVARRLKALLSDPNQAQLLRTLSGLEDATRAVASAARKLEPTLRELPAVTDSARKSLGRADELMANLNRLTVELTKRVDALERVSHSAEQVGGAAQTFSRAAVDDTLPRINALIDELARNSRQLERLLDGLGGEPSSLIFGRPATAPGPGEAGFVAPGGSR